MTTITVPLSEERLAQLRDLAQRAGVSAEEFVRARLEDWLRQPHDDFAAAARYVLQNNAELYRRLALAQTAGAAGLHEEPGRRPFQEITRDVFERRQDAYRRLA